MRSLLLAPAVLALLLSLAAGCQQSPTPSGVARSTDHSATRIDAARPNAALNPPPNRDANAEGVENVPEGAAATPTPAALFPAPPAEDLAGGQLLEEAWDAYAMQGIRIGYSRTTVVRLIENGRELLRTRSVTRTAMERSGQSVSQAMTLTSWDTPAGELVRFETRMSAGGASEEVVSRGAVVQGAPQRTQLAITTTTLGQTQSQTIPWTSGGGLFAAEQSLRRKPLQPEEARRVRGLLPIFNQPGETQLTALDWETVKLPTTPPSARGGSEEVEPRKNAPRELRLLKVKSTIDLGGQKLEAFLWIDAHGEVLKSLVPSIGQETMRTTEADALRRSAGAQYDLLVASTVPLAGTLADPLHTRRAVYRVHLKSGSIAGLFSQCLSQRVEPIDDQTARLSVLAIRPDRPTTIDAAISITQPVEDDLAPNNFVQSDDPAIRAMAERVLPGERDAWTLATALERFVQRTVQNKNFSQAFATAAEVARTLEGDCTEHAVLLAALCRARRIPARVAFGLVYYPPEHGFAYHMWTEAWIADRWVPLDATLGLGGIGADHIKLGDANLAGGSPLAELLAVIQVFGRLEIEVLAAE